jgi:hypothetical protein
MKEPLDWLVSLVSHRRKGNREYARVADHDCCMIGDAGVTDFATRQVIQRESET